MHGMLTTPAQRRGEEAGFTLVELMVVVLVIGILIAIALPTYVGARTRAQNRAAQTELRNAYVAASTYYAANQSYNGFTTITAAQAEPSVSWIGAGPPPPALGNVSIQFASGDSLLLIEQAKTGTYWCIAQVPGSPLNQKGGDSTWANVNTTPQCNQGW
jgi:type IV pilus assembly protein PilA